MVIEQKKERLVEKLERKVHDRLVNQIDFYSRGLALHCITYDETFLAIKIIPETILETLNTLLKREE